MINIFYREGSSSTSDLAVVKMKHKVEEHHDYDMGVPLQPIRLATENPKIGDKVLTAGWGVTGYNERVSKELRSLELTITSTADIWVYTDNYDEEGRLTDTCKGDSGGPLAIQRDGVWEIVGVLFVSLLLLLSSFRYLQSCMIIFLEGRGLQL